MSGDVLFFKDSEFYKKSRFIPGINFHESEKIWNIFSNRFDEHLKTWENKPENEIPKIIHQIWLGSKIPRELKVLTDTLKKNNKDCEYILWDEKKISELNLINKNAYEKSKNYAVKSDIARLEILNKFGGMYFDTDFELFKKIPDIYRREKFLVGLAFGNKSYPVVGNSFIFSTPGHDLIKNLLLKIDNKPCYNDNPESVMGYLGPYKISELLINYISEKKQDWLVLPSNIFYPWPSFDRENDEIKYSYITSDTIGMHHWHISWIPRWRKLLHWLYRKIK